MRKAIVFVMFLVGCAVHPRPLAPGDTPCHTDGECFEGEHCGFRHVDSYAVCRTGVR